MNKIFISYSWDSDEHQQWVKKLADDLETYEEFHIVLDQYDLDSTKDKNLFMEEAVFDTDIIIIICTKKYADKANSRQGGVGIETFLTTTRHWEESENVGSSNIIAIAREDRNLSIPRYLKGKFSVNFQNNDEYTKSLEFLLKELNTICEEKNVRPKKTKSLHHDKFNIYDFDRVDDILAINYKNRQQLDTEKDFSGKNKIRYEFWEITPLEKSYILVLFDNINIKQTIERFVEKNKFIPKKITVLRINNGEVGYVEKQFRILNKNVTITEHVINDFVWDYCIDQEWKKENNVTEEEFFIDQTLYSSDNNKEDSVGLSLDYIHNVFLQTTKTPVLMLFASGGVGKSTLCLTLNNKINEDESRKAVMIQSEYIRENIDKEISKNYKIDNIYQLYDIYMRVASNTKSLLNEKQFDLGVLSGKIIVIIDGLDEIISLFQENFNLINFLESLMSLNQQMGNSKIIITSRLNILQNNIFIKEKDYIELVYLHGFEEKIWKQYLRNRFSRYSDSQNYIDKVEIFLGDLVKKEKDNILPFYLDLICEIVEEDDNTFIVETITKDYNSNNESMDYLIHAILKREITRQQFNISLVSLVDLFKELSVTYGDRFSHENLKEQISIYFDSNDSESIYKKILLNPLLSYSSDLKTLKFKYDFLSNYFIVLYLIENMEQDFRVNSPLKPFIVQLTKLYDGTHIILNEIVKYFKKDVSNCVKQSKDILAKLIIEIKKDTKKNNNNKRAISALLYLNQKIYGEHLSKDKRREKFNLLFDSSNLEYLFIWGKYYPIDFSDLEIWSSEFHKFDNFCKSTFLNTSFYHSQFYDTDISGKCTDLSSCTFDECVLGDISSVIGSQKDAISGKINIVEKDIKIFFRNFTDRSNFVYKEFNNITIPNRLHNKPKKFIDLLISKSVLEKEPLVLKKSYGIVSSYHKDVSTFMNNNHMTPKMKKLIDELAETE